MRKALLLITFFISLSAFAQKSRNPGYYLNGREISINKVFINPLRIDSISVDKKTKDGEIYIFTKNRVFSSLDLNEVLTKYTKLSSPNDSLLFMINGKIIPDVSDIKIDDTFFIYVVTKTMSDVNYLAVKFKNLTIVDINLEKELKPIMIRGNQTLLSQISK